MRRSKGHDLIRVEMVQITPDLALGWLQGRNTKNRPLKKNLIKRLSSQFSRGEIIQTSSLIAFGPDDRLIDGQHRLWAIVESGVTVEFLVGYGFADESFYYTDSGVKRTLADHLQVAKPDLKNRHVMASAINAVGEWRANVVAGTMVPNIITQSRAGELWSAARLVEFHDDNEEIFDLGVHAGMRIQSVLGHGTKPWATLMTLAWSIDADDAEAFEHAIVKGEGQVPRLLYDMMLRDLAHPVTKPPNPVLAYSVKTWNAWRIGRAVSALRWKSGGSKREPFPMMDGWDDSVLIFQALEL